MTTNTKQENIRIQPAKVFIGLKSKHNFKDVCKDCISNGRVKIHYNKQWITVESMLFGQVTKARLTRATSKSVMAVVNAYNKGERNQVKHVDVKTVLPPAPPKPKTNEVDEMAKAEAAAKQDIDIDDISADIPEENWESPAEKKAKEDKAAKAKAGGKNKSAEKKEAEEKVLTMPEKVTFEDVDGKIKTVDTSKVFDQVSGQFNKDRSMREEIEKGWTALAESFGYSIKPVVRALLKEGKWPIGVDKNGKQMESRDYPGEFAPMGYKAKYKAEIDAGQDSGIGHMVNVAAAAFGRAKRNAGLTEAGQRDRQQGGPGATPSASTSSEKSVDEKLEAMNAIARSLTQEDLLSWLENDKLISELVDRIVDSRFASMLNEESAA